MGPLRIELKQLSGWLMFFWIDQSIALALTDVGAQNNTEFPLGR
jgi:hypothetical protein